MIEVVKQTEGKYRGRTRRLRGYVLMNTERYERAEKAHRLDICASGWKEGEGEGYQRTGGQAPPRRHGRGTVGERTE